VDNLGSQVHPLVQVFFPNNDAIFQVDDLPIHTARSVPSWFEEREDALQSLLASTIAQLKYHRTTVVSYRKQGEKQISSISCQATRRRVVQYSTRDYSELT